MYVVTLKSLIQMHQIKQKFETLDHKQYLKRRKKLYALDMHNNEPPFEKKCRQVY